uniref:Histidine kinase n=1 Tax=Rhabditophanes sp. KR3021 TaxID=114890 RepID=A0AC35UA12_9BILA
MAVRSNCDIGSKIGVEMAYSSHMQPKDLELKQYEYIESFDSPLVGALHGFLDDIIEASTTIITICEDLKTLRNKKSKHIDRKHADMSF